MLNGEAGRRGAFGAGFVFLFFGLGLSVSASIDHDDRNSGLGQMIGGSASGFGALLMLLAWRCQRSCSHARVDRGARRPIRRRAVETGQPAAEHAGNHAPVVEGRGSGRVVALSPLSDHTAVRSPTHSVSLQPPSESTRGGDGRRRVPIGEFFEQKRQRARTLVQTRGLTSVLSDVLSNVQTIKPLRPLDMVSEGAMYVATLRGQAIEVNARAVDAAKAAIKRSGCWFFLFQCVKPKGGVAEIRLSRSDDADTESDTVSLSGLSTNSGMTVGSTVSSVSWKSDDYVAVDPKALELPKAARRSRIVVVEPPIPGTVTPLPTRVLSRPCYVPQQPERLYRLACPIGCVYHLNVTAANMCAFGHRESLLSDGRSVIKDGGKFHFCDQSALGPMPV